MAQLNGTDFLTKWATFFADNTTGDISAEDMRDFRLDIKDSFLNLLDNAYSVFTITASGTDSYSGTLSPAITSYGATHVYAVKFTNANTGASTINLNSLGAKSIVKNGSSALVAGDIAAGQIILLAYDGTNLQVIGRPGLGGTTGSADNAILRADGTGGSTVQASDLFIDDFGNMDIPGASGTISGLSQIRCEIGVSNNSTGTTQVLRIFHHGQLIAGTGPVMQFAARTSTGNDEVGATIEAASTDATAGSEDFDFIIKTMAAGAAAAERVRVNNNGLIVTGKFYLSALNTAPANASDTGTAGEIRIDANHIYICTATNTWKRVAIATW
jgi:hypothetical protein